MKPYYEDRWVKIFLGDCREILPVLDVKVDLVLTDPPYGVGIDYGIYQDTRENWVDLMNWLIPFSRLTSQMSIMPCSRIMELPFIYQNHIPDWLICWYKGSPGTSAFVGFNDWEPLLVYGKPKGLMMHDYFYCPATPFNNGHPCPKPENWANHLISRASQIDNLILDPFLGSGTTCYCAKKLNRYSVGIEIEERYAEIAAKRCSQEVFELGL